ncbi:ABC transporter permease [uncultured Imperialibacter sp.]|uniref:ABC transporter permease n=1 Tax=uncultured Imperialibacter sp. TaxID=1672639 RepID=UPI0030D72EAA|tara:strand:- start:26177 stop:28798 length:2622 start_codon:yes stop_codon:yes gene_type:complete
MNRHITPPKFPLRFFRWFCHPEYREDIEGDLVERFEKRVEERGKTKANWIFTLEVLRLCRPGIFRPFKPINKLSKQAMLYHYSKVTYRNFLRNKAFSAINLSGLVIGMVAALILAKYVGFTLRYDQFHQHKDNIVEIDQAEAKDGVATSYQHSTYWETAAKVKEQYPEVRMASLYSRDVEKQVTVADESGSLVKFNERNMFSADPDFTQMFSFQFIEGDSTTALSQPNSVVITRSVAKKYFGDAKAFGKAMKTTTAWGAENTLHVTGVVEEVPVYSRFRFDFLKSTIGFNNYDQWGFANYPTYLLLTEEANPTELASKIATDINDVEQIKADGREVELALIPLSDVRLSEMEIMLLLVGVFILLITWINFINLTSAQSMSRHKETGIRKVLGSEKREIVRQFIFEGMTINLLALAAAVLIVWLLYPFIETYTNGKLLPLFGDPTPMNWLFLLLFLLGALIASSYPALILSSLDPIRSIKGRVLDNTKGAGFRKVLVVVQFSISIILITGIFVISDQMRFLKNQPLGITLDQTLIVKSAKDGADDRVKRHQAFKEGVANLSFTRGVTSSTQVPGGGNGQDIYFNIEGKNITVSANLIGVDASYMAYYGAKIIAGEDFSKDKFWASRRSILINRSTALAMGCSSPEEAIGQTIIIPENEDRTLKVLGVVEDFHQNSLKEKIQPMTFEFNPFRGHASIKIDSGSYSNYEELAACLAQIERIWDEVHPDQVFEYYFLDEQFNSNYQEDIRFSQLFSVFTGISVFVASLGLFGMSMFVARKKKREVGIRKVFGASVASIVNLFCRGYVGQLSVAVLIGSPVAYLLMHKWLEGYILRTSVSLTAIVAPVALLLVISFVSISTQVMKAATANPINALRDE